MLLNPYRFIPFVAMSAPDYYFDDVSLLLHGEGLDSSKVIVDSSRAARVGTVTGNAEIRTLRKKFGVSSIFFDGAQSSVQYAADSAFYFADGDFTIETFVIFITAPGIREIITGNAASSGVNATVGTVVDRRADGKISGFGCSGSVVVGECVGTTVTQANQLYHIAYTRQGSIFRLWVNGVLEATKVASGVLNNSPNKYAVGGLGEFTTGLFLKGYIDEFRITKGVARYPSVPVPVFSFPKDASDPNWAQTVLLLKGNGVNGSAAVLDSSPAAQPITVVGNAQITTAQSEFDGASIAFDGTGDYLLTDARAEFNFQTANLTIEASVSLDSIQAQPNPVLFETLPDYAGSNWVAGAFSIHFNRGTASGVYVWAYNFSPTVALLEAPAVVFNGRGFRHVVVLRDGSEWRLFVDGVLLDTTTWTGSPTTAAQRATIGGAYNSASGFKGCIDELRITKGAARYPLTPFTLPAAEFSNELAYIGRAVEINPSIIGGVNQETYSYTLSANYAVAPVTWSVAAGTLPPGLHLNPTTGVISGIPNTTNGEYAVTIRAVDALGRASTRQFVIPVGTMVSLLHFDGANGSNVLTDATGKTWSAAGASLTTVEKKFGTAAGNLPGNGARWYGSNNTADFDFTAVPFTVRAWVRPTSQTAAASFRGVIGNRGGAIDELGDWMLYQNQSGLGWNFEAPETAAGWNGQTRAIALPGGAPTLNQWQFITGGWDVNKKLRSSRDGVANSGYTMTSLNREPTNNIVVGTLGQGHVVDNNSFKGQIDEIAIIKGAYLYQENFAIPTTPSDYPQPVRALSVSGSLPQGFFDTTYSSTTDLKIQGSGTPFAISVLSGALPAGWELEAVGNNIQVGGPTAPAGFYTFTLRVTDASNNTADIPLSVEISSATGVEPAVVINSGVMGGVNQETYSYTFSTTYAVAPVFWSIVSGSLPQGLHLNSSTGVISGVPNAAVGEYTAVVKVVDALGRQGELPILIPIGQMVSLLHFDGANGATSMTDVTGKSWSRGGNAQLSTTEKQFGTASSLHDGAGDYWETSNNVADFDFSATSFTVRASVRPISIQAGKYPGIVGVQGPTGTDPHDWMLYHQPNGSVLMQAYNQDTAGPLAIGSSAVAPGVWSFLTCGWASKDKKLRVSNNGIVNVHPTSFSQFRRSAAVPLRVGVLGASPDHGFHGYIDEIAIIKGAYLYQENFTPPTTPSDYPKAPAPLAFNGSLPTGAALVDYDSSADLKIHGTNTPFTVLPIAGNLPSGWSADVVVDRVRVQGPGLEAGDYGFTLRVRDFAAYTNLLLALRFDGANNSTNYVEAVSDRAVTPVGGAKISTSRSKYGPSAGYFDGVDDYLALAGGPVLPATTDFSIGAWIYREVAGAAHQIFAQGTPGVLGRAYFLVTDTNKLNFFVGGVAGGDPNVDLIGVANVPAEQWVYVLASRVGNTYRLFVNGVLDATGTAPQAIEQTSNIYVGRNDLETAGVVDRFFHGYIEDLTVSNVARTANFTPPAAPNVADLPLTVRIS